MSALAIALTADQVEAAGRLYSQLRQWQVSEAALDALADRVPGFSEEAVLLKAVAVNGLYGTNVLALSRMAIHVRKTIEKSDLRTAGPELVEGIARLPREDGETANRRHHSFASKFAHFFIDAERFPIMDSYAVAIVRVHLGVANYNQNREKPYLAFVENLKTLRTLAELNVTNREFDRYLWIAGAYRTYRKCCDAERKAKISVELNRLFTNPSESIRGDLDALMPSILSPTVRGGL